MIQAQAMRLMDEEMKTNYLKKQLYIEVEDIEIALNKMKF